ncbi:hypothetical protein ASPWEDRAFT_237629 [Aspergillus wentii DTO 134E9]|uniref:Uncharacterized protein n=1 Tax=Aspergillus wentii DTO 134E9 TaxID=1073089 RepID=A0A1L9S195_ASPWE|nr:uncharacterized protein ASPWEDRAFT_237629 [Aspergillus wentii DTO 134E9]OJJ40914.1 hypothetical protein ASPWEDRAFT_237629 [Aspergillus wentii DTO 134E9]
MHRLPLDLKGSDLAIYSVFHHLGLTVKTLPLLRSRLESLRGENRSSRFTTDSRWQLNDWRKGKRHLQLDLIPICPQSSIFWNDIEKRWKMLFMTHVISRKNSNEYFEKGTWIGRKCHAYQADVHFSIDTDPETVRQYGHHYWQYYHLPSIIWLNWRNSAQWDEREENPSSLKHFGIIAVIPSWQERMQMMN